MSNNLDDRLMALMMEYIGLEEIVSDVPVLAYLKRLNKDFISLASDFNQQVSDISLEARKE